MSRSIAVVGGGITGLLLALEASSRGLEVVVYEESEALGRGASGHNAGVVHVIQLPPWKLKSRLARRGNRDYDRLSVEAGFRLMRLPAYLVYTTTAERLYAPAAAAALRLMGYAVSLAPRREVLEQCPDASPVIKGAVKVTGYATLVPQEALEALARRADEEGVEIKLGTRVRRVKEEEGGVTLDLGGGGLVTYDYAVIAAGAGSAALAKSAGIKPPRLAYYKGVMAVARLECNAILAPLRSRSRTSMTKGGGVIPWPDGKVILGPTFTAAQDPWESSVTQEEASKAAGLYTGILGHAPQVTEAFAGTRVKNMDTGDFKVAVRGRTAALLGIDSPGLTAAPRLARNTLDKLLARRA